MIKLVVASCLIPLLISNPVLADLEVSKNVNPVQEVSPDKTYSTLGRLVKASYYNGCVDSIDSKLPGEALSEALAKCEERSENFTNDLLKNALSK